MCSSATIDYTTFFSEEAALESTDIPTFGEAVASFRTRASLSQQQLAKQLGKNRRAVAAWEGGEYLPKAKGDVLELARILALNDEEATTLLKAAGIDPSLAIWNLPFPRNPFFTARDQELEQLHTQLQQGTITVMGQAQSISGLGGIGKTQLAIEYAYRHRHAYQYVLWARAESVEALIASFTEMAYLLNLPEKDAEEQAITIQAVKRWLQRQRSWLLILDNADSPALLPAFLPPTVGGHLLITTCAADVSTHMAGLAHPLMVDTFSDEQGALFLLQRSGLLALGAVLHQAELHIQQSALEMAHELGGLPLALDQAGAYLHATGCSPATYQQIYQQHHIQLLAQRRGADHPKPVATTWNISFRKVEQQNPAAADLLRLCAFLAQDAIPEAILTEGAEDLGPALAPVVADAYLLNEAIEALRTYSLINRDPCTQALTIHRLVQTVLRDSMPCEAQQQWIQRAVHAVASANPGPDFVNWSIVERLLPHALTCATWIKQAQLATPAAAHLLNQLGYYLINRARYAEAEGLYQAALKILEEESGDEYPFKADILNDLAVIYVKQSKYEQAEIFHKRALAIYEQRLGLEHPSTAACLNNLAVLYEKQARYSLAESFALRALAIYEQQAGREHFSIARTLNNLALIYEQQGKYGQAEPLLKRALAICEQRLGLEHPDTAQSLSHLAFFDYKQGKYEQAESRAQHALTIYEQQLGSEHPDTAQSLNNLAMIYEQQRKYEQAEPLLKHALTVREKNLGPEHPDIAQNLNNLATIYRAQGRYSEAEPLYRRALEIYEQQLGSIPHDVGNTLNNLASLYQALGRYGEAESLYQRALEIYEQTLGAVPTTATCLNNLAGLYQIQGRHGEAEPLYQHALEIYMHILGLEHPATQTVLVNYAIPFLTMRRDAKAEGLEEDSDSCFTRGSVLEE